MKLNTALKETMEFPGCAFREVFIGKKKCSVACLSGDVVHIFAHSRHSGCIVSSYFFVSNGNKLLKTSNLISLEGANSCESESWKLNGSFELRMYPRSECNMLSMKPAPWKNYVNEARKKKKTSHWWCSVHPVLWPITVTSLLINAGHVMYYGMYHTDAHRIRKLWRAVCGSGPLNYWPFYLSQNEELQMSPLWELHVVTLLKMSHHQSEECPEETLDSYRARQTEELQVKVWFWLDNVSVFFLFIFYKETWSQCCSVNLFSCTGLHRPFPLHPLWTVSITVDGIMVEIYRRFFWFLLCVCVMAKGSMFLIALLMIYGAYLLWISTIVMNGHVWNKGEKDHLWDMSEPEFLRYVIRFSDQIIQ